MQFIVMKPNFRFIMNNLRRNINHIALALGFFFFSMDISSYPHLYLSCLLRELSIYFSVLQLNSNKPHLPCSTLTFTCIVVLLSAQLLYRCMTNQEPRAHFLPNRRFMMIHGVNESLPF